MYNIEQLAIDSAIQELVLLPSDHEYFAHPHSVQIRIGSRVVTIEKIRLGNKYVPNTLYCGMVTHGLSESLVRQKYLEGKRVKSL